METGPDTWTDEQIALKAKCLALLESGDLEGFLMMPMPPFDPPSWEELGRPDLMGSPHYISTDHGTTYTFSPASTAVKKTRDGSHA
jgi:hypothetical protein